MPDAPWSPAAFEERHARAGDPWSFATSAYELGRYDAIEAALRPHPHRYRSGYEPACSIGVLTERLAERCDALLATDVAPSAVASAQQRCAGCAGVTISVGSLEAGPHPADPPDLVVISEVGYYLEREELADVVRRLVAAAAPGADLVACHWTGASDDHRLHGREVHEVLALVLGPPASPSGRDGHDGFLLDTWRLR
jgi:hypothetical protein